ncbi:hypothetical protein [Beggiatoa alba]|uniref:hypothetical protein n=1 Tax=Beggiatoa alba TaxID=1022 RepID=UPI000300CE8B|nr:hypothetical protein [Beggiatoa alba]
MLNVVEKPKRYEKALKAKIDKEIQLFLDDAEQYLAFYLKNRHSIDITEKAIS